MKNINIGIIGLGTVGSGVITILEEKKSTFQSRGVNFNIKYICDISEDSGKKFPGYKFTDEFRDVISDDSVDVIMELIGGTTVAYDIIDSALDNGKSVITANKALLAERGKELFARANKKNLYIGFEASVAGGIPIIQIIRQGLCANEIQSIYGIINGTCNYILTKMSRTKCDFSLALKEAQKLGFAEADPALDISGMDTAHKLTILGWLSFNGFIKPSDIFVEGIEGSGNGREGDFVF